MQIDDSCVSFESGFGQKRRLTKDRAAGLLESDIAALEQKSKGMWTAIEKVREVNMALKKEVQALADGMREDFKQKAKAKTERIEAILSTVDAKVQFVVESCDRTIQSLREQMNQYIKTSSREGEERQAIILTYNQMAERMRVLQQKIFSHRHVEEQLRRQLQAVTQQNNALVQELNGLAGRSNDKIEQLEAQLRQKVDEIRRKEIEMMRKEEALLRKEQDIGKAAIHQPSLLPPHQPPHQPMNQFLQAPQPPSGPNQQTMVKQHHQYSQPQLQPAPPKPPQQPQQDNFKQPASIKPITAHPVVKQQPPPALEDVSISVSRTAGGNHNNAIQIKPDFFKGGQESQLSEYSQVVECRGINLKSLSKDDTPNGINVRKLKESSDSGGMNRFNKKDQNHRFDYLISNLAATQGESTQISEGFNESLMSRDQPVYQTPSRR